MNAKDTMDGIYQKGGSFKENRNGKEMNTYNHNETVEISVVHKEKREPGEFNTHSILKAE